MTTSSATEQVTAVPGELHYLAPGSTVLRRFTAPGASVNTGRYDSHVVPIAEQVPDGPGYRRALATSVWRVFSPPPQDWPLALCDFRSVRADEGLPNQLYFVDRVPEDPFAAVDESKMITSGSEFHHSPDHEWWYFPNMNRDEVLFFVFHDSDHSRAWRTPHTAFRDPTVEAAVPRHSIEFRTFAFFH